MRRINKHGNNKHYIVPSSKGAGDGGYICLGDIARMIRGGETIEARCASTGTDLTNQVLKSTYLFELKNSDISSDELYRGLKDEV